jgi:hypothetical protein
MGFDYPQKQRVSYSQNKSISSLGTIQTSTYTGIGATLPGYECDQSPRSAEVKNAWRFPPSCFREMSLGHRDIVILFI